MRHLNYGQLRQFHEVAREGSVAKAAQRLHVTPQTISGQVKQLEATVGEPLLQRAGRGLTLTATGRLVYGYTERLFAIGEELVDQLGHRSGAREVVRIGLVDAVPKLLACRVLSPALGMTVGPSGDPDGGGPDGEGDEGRQEGRHGHGGGEARTAYRLHCIDGTLDTLLGRLAAHELDLVLSDRPVPPGHGVRAWNHVLGEGGTAFYAAPALADGLRAGFPASLHGAPMLLPDESHALRRRLDTWFDQHGIVPRIVGEFADSSLMKTFGDTGVGAFPSPLSMRAAIEHGFHAGLIGVCDGVGEQLIAIAPERRLRHPAVVSIASAARDAFA